MENQKNPSAANGVHRAAGEMKSGAGDRRGQKDPKDRVAAEIEENLRRVYSQTLEEKVPDRFTQLIEQLKQKGAPK